MKRFDTRTPTSARPSPMFDHFDFLYLPSRDVAADAAHLSSGLGGTVVFAVERFGNRVAMVRMTPHGPPLVLAGHLEGEQPISVFRVSDLAAATADLRRRRVEVGPEFEMPFGIGVELRGPGPQRIAIYQRTQAERGARLTGRVDFAIGPRTHP